ncbi:MAG: RDD family protein [Acidobacteria bacterium]|nr:RDD family protein [Acidobacteriota bacterium]
MPVPPPTHAAGQNCAPMPRSKGAASPASPSVLRAMPAAAARVSRPAQALPRELRRELSARVRQFRSRQLHPTLPLRFSESPETGSRVLQMEAAVAKTLQPLSPLARPRPARRPRSTPPHSAPLSQPELNFPTVPVEEEAFPLLPVAPLLLRMIGQAVDFSLTLAALVVFCVAAKLTLGPVIWDRFLLASALAAYFFILLLYGAIFLWLAGTTPAMKCLHLRLVDFDGRTPGRAQRLWRFLGVIVSAGSFLLGFWWAAADEETLSWHDRISKTFLVKSNP